MRRRLEKTQRNKDRLGRYVEKIYSKQMQQGLGTRRKRFVYWAKNQLQNTRALEARLTKQRIGDTFGSGCGIKGSPSTVRRRIKNGDTNTRSIGCLGGISFRKPTRKDLELIGIKAKRPPPPSIRVDPPTVDVKDSP